MQSHSLRSLLDHHRFNKRSPLGVVLGLVGALIVLVLFWELALIPLGWPDLRLVGHYFLDTIGQSQTYKALLATGIRALCGMAIGFCLAVAFGLLTGRTVLGWIAFFFLLLLTQKIPAVAALHVLVRSKLGIGFAMTVTLAALVTLTFTWQVLHHRAETLDPREAFALRVLGLRGWELFFFGLLPHLGAALGGAARLSASIATVLVVLGEWQGVWSDGSIWQYGLGVQISRAYDSVDSEAKVLAFCVWLGVLGILFDLGIQAGFVLVRRVVGVDFKR